MKKYARIAITCAFITLVGMIGRAFAGNGQYICVLVDDGPVSVQTDDEPSLTPDGNGGYSVTIDGKSYSLIYWWKITDSGSIIEYPSTTSAAQIGQVPAWATTWICGAVTEQTSPSYLATQYITSGGSPAVRITFDGIAGHHAVVTTY